MDEIIDHIALEYISNPVNSGLSIGIIKDNKANMYFYGTVDKSVKQTPTSKTFYEIGSVTKTFTGIVLAHAVNEKKLKLDDDIRQYLPGKYPNLEYDGYPISVLMLSNHTAGFPNMHGDYNLYTTSDKELYKIITKKFLLEYLKSFKLTYQPGTVYNYSSIDVAILGMILENIYGKSIDHLIKLYVTNHANMKHTKFKLTDNQENKRSKGYRLDGSSAKKYTFDVYKASGGLKSTLEDMIKYLYANMREINQDFALSHQQTFIRAQGDKLKTIGLGWMMVERGDDTFIFHNGLTAGFNCLCGYFKKKQIGLVLLSNSMIDIDDVKSAIFKYLGI